MADATATQPDSLPINAVSSLVVNNDEEVPLDDEGIEKDSLTSETTVLCSERVSSRVSG